MSDPNLPCNPKNPGWVGGKNPSQPELSLRELYCGGVYEFF